MPRDGEEDSAWKETLVAPNSHLFPGRHFSFQKAVPVRTVAILPLNATAGVSKGWRVQRAWDSACQAATWMARSQRHLPRSPSGTVGAPLALTRTFTHSASMRTSSEHLARASSGDCRQRHDRYRARAYARCEASLTRLCSTSKVVLAPSIRVGRTRSTGAVGPRSDVAFV